MVQSNRSNVFVNKKWRENGRHGEQPSPLTKILTMRSPIQSELRCNFINDNFFFSKMNTTNSFSIKYYINYWPCFIIVIQLKNILKFNLSWWVKNGSIKIENGCQ